MCIFREKYRLRFYEISILNGEIQLAKYSVAKCKNQILNNIIITQDNITDREKI